MKHPLFTVQKKGLLTTFQDRGRFRYQQFGVVTGGAMDTFSYEIANLLVGNQNGEACIEVTMIGPELIVEAEEVLISVCGADLSFKVNGAYAPIWKSFYVKKGDIMSFGEPKSGVRAYLAVAGGYQANYVLGSQSYDLKAQLGTKIEVGQLLYGYKTNRRKRMGLNIEFIPAYPKDISVRVIIGPHEDYFTPDSIKQFLSDTYKVVQGDRMGLRLVGNSLLKHRNHADIPSEAIPLGGVQVPSSGEPIILLADRQTTGGYTRIANVISVDIDKLAQLPPGGTIRFQEVTIEEAHMAYKNRQRFIKRLKALS